MRTFTLLIGLFLSMNVFAQTYMSKKGKVNFTSDAPMEVINANSDDLVGLIKQKTKQFAFSIQMTSFEGFNSELQKEHFNENYVESEKYPKATFSGTIVEDFDLSKDGTYKVNAKGKLTIHGITKERTISATITVKDGKVSIYSKFTVLLEDHDIERPTVVFQKIAEKIFITVNMDLTKKQ